MPPSGRVLGYRVAPCAPSTHACPLCALAGLRSPSIRSRDLYTDVRVPLGWPASPGGALKLPLSA